MNGISIKGEAIPLLNFTKGEETMSFNNNAVNDILRGDIDKQAIHKAANLILDLNGFMDAYTMLSFGEYRNELDIELILKLLDLIFKSPIAALLLVRSKDVRKPYIESASEVELKHIFELILKSRLSNKDQILKVLITRLSNTYNINEKINKLNLNKEDIDRINSMIILFSLV